MPKLRRALAAAPLSARCYKNIASALQPTSLPTFLDNNILAISGIFSTMLVTDSHSVKHSDNARSQVKKERDKIDPGDCSVVVHGTVPSKQTAMTSHGRERGIGAAIPHLYRKGEDSIAVILSIMHLKTRTGSQLPEQSQYSFSIPTADVEEASAILSGNGMFIGQRAHLRDIESYIWLLDLLRELLPNAL
ncbi:hypothetical protein V498_06879 [Pseudogymnoascus sp. VKM F-4517 (FW-2822)]|nr:hypothetical protein V498_06879 [Pseudogymnoascus sp. VKM F-4517 (FW-2822)]